MRLQPLSLVASFLALVHADVSVTSPAAGASIAAGAVTVSFVDSGSAPTFSQLTSFTCELVQGGQTDTQQRSLVTFATGATFTSGLSLTATVAPGVAGALANGFFFKFTSVVTEGGTVINYSNRFSITGLTGTNPTNIVSAVQALGGSTAGPPTVEPAQAAAGGANAAPGAAQWTIPYNLQTGLTKWAPMQPIPGSKITAKNYTPLFPTSNVPTATTWVLSPSIVTTVTQSQTYSVSTIENPASAASQPTGDMAKYLRRWAD